VISCLSIHAAYRCQHAGACCAAPWQVKADEHILEFVATSPRFANRVDELFVSQASRPGGAPERSVAKQPDGGCVFHHDRRCDVHTEAGEGALPIGCRHYPRVVRIDRAGVAVSLSHYCPTAASLLASDASVRVVAAAPPLAPGEPLEGLDTRTALPPLLCPDVLMDLDAYDAWERGAIDKFSNSGRADVALRRIASATDVLRRWRPGTLTLETALNAALARSDDIEPAWMAQGLPIARALNRGIVSLEAGNPPAPDHDPRAVEAVERVIANYLAARVFGNWIAYQGRGLRTIVTWLSACHAVVRLLIERERLAGVAGAIEAIRQADYVMLHTIDTQEFANAARSVEA
jgi:hypothetical protein